MTWNELPSPLRHGLIAAVYLLVGGGGTMGIQEALSRIPETAALAEAHDDQLERIQIRFASEDSTFILLRGSLEAIDETLQEYHDSAVAQRARRSATTTTDEALLALLCELLPEAEGCDSG